jgi:hypothetical protein
MRNMQIWHTKGGLDSRCKMDNIYAFIIQPNVKSLVLTMHDRASKQSVATTLIDSQWVIVSWNTTVSTPSESMMSTRLSTRSFLRTMWSIRQTLTTEPIALSPDTVTDSLSSYTSRFASSSEYIRRRITSASSALPFR